MNILIVAATELEIGPFLQYLRQSYKQLGTDIFFNDQHRVQILITGVGMVATTFALTKQLCEKTYDAALQVGIAGSFDRTISLTSLCAVSTEVFGDLGAEDRYQFWDVFELGLDEKDRFPFKNGMLENSFQGLPFEIAMTQVSALSVNMVSGSELTAETRLKKFNCQLESMEGAAFHYICLKSEIPFLQVRAVSNYVEARDKTKWKIKEAVIALNEWMIQLVG